MNKKIIFTINCGSTSTKVALFHDKTLIKKKDVPIDIDQIKDFKNVADELDIREEAIQEFMKEEGIDPSAFDIIVARGGAIPTVPHRAYKVNDYMVDLMKYAPKVQHASNLSCLIGQQIAKPYKTPVIIYDASALDETDPVTKITGLPQIERNPVSHVLNTRKVAREVAGEIGKPYKECSFIVAHLGGGISLNAHKNGRIVDFVCHDELHMSPSRTGGFRLVPLWEYLISEKDTLSPEAFFAITQSQGGLLAHLGLHDTRDVEALIDKGDKKAKDVYYAMAYQIAKSIGNLAPVLYGKVDRIILTGGIAYSKLFTGWIKERVSFIAPVEIVPGEREMEALALGGLHVLQGKEEAFEFDVLPKGYSSIEEFRKKIVSF